MIVFHATDSAFLDTVCQHDIEVVMRDSIRFKKGYALLIRRALMRTLTKLGTRYEERS